jgi:hypothetical protein
LALSQQVFCATISALLHGVKWTEIGHFLAGLAVKGMEDCLQRGDIIPEAEVKTKKSKTRK